MNKEDDQPWTAEEIEEWEHDEWLKLHEMGDEAYKEVEEEFERRRWSEEEENKEDEEMEEGPYEKEERKRWREEEEKAREAYFLEIRQEEERGIYRQTVAELIEEEIAARKLGKKMERE